MCSVAAGTPRSGWHLTKPCDTSGSKRHRLRRQRCADRLPPLTKRPTVCTEAANPANKSPAWTTREPSCRLYCETSHNHTRPESTDLMRQSTARVWLPILELDDSYEISRWRISRSLFNRTERTGRHNLWIFESCGKETVPVTETRIARRKLYNSTCHRHTAMCCCILYS